MDGFLSGRQTGFATEVVVITDGWSRRRFVPLAIKSHSAWCCWVQIFCAPCPLLWIAGACRADLMERATNFCYHWRRQVANHLGWKERREEGDVNNFNAEVRWIAFCDKKIGLIRCMGGSWDDTFWTPIQAPLRVLIQPLGEFTPSYILHTRVFGTYLLGGYLPCKKDYKVMVFYV